MNKKIFGLLIVSLVAISMASMVNAAGGNVVEVSNSNQHQAKLQAQTQTTYQFRQRTQLRINSSSPVELNMDCDANAIGDKTFDIEITSTENDEDIELNMTCREEEAQLGVQAGATVRNRNRNRVRVNYGFAVNLTSNQSCTAKLGMEMSSAEASGNTWAYFDEEAEEWVPVDSEYVDGMLVAETDHFSTWTIVTAETSYLSYILMGVGGIALIGIIAFAVKKRQ